MFEIIAPALIAAAASIAVCLISNASIRKETDRKHSETIALIEYKLEELTKKVEKHNNIIERTYKLEELTSLQEEKIKVANHRIEDLERRTNA